MTDIQRIKNLEVPDGKIDVVLDTDAYNEIDDQFAISYMLLSGEKLNVKAIYAAPFFNNRSTSPADGMEKSYEELKRLMDIMKSEVEIFKGSDRYLEDEKTAVSSPAAEHLARLADGYSPEKPLYVVAIGAITNVASAILLNPAVANNTVVVWLGGHAVDFMHQREFNLYQDVAAARVVISSGVPFVQLPCMGVVSAFTISKPELEYWLVGKNPLADYLAKCVIDEADGYALGKPWTRVIWDVTAVAWLLNDNDRFMNSRIIHANLPSYDNHLTICPDAHPMRYVYNICRDALMEDLINKIASF